ncbi:MAG: hypothetical protein AAF492_31705, partial [Verrucomicrobiota bacterium]
MKRNLILLLAALSPGILLGDTNSPIHYADEASTNPVPPYCTWATAATNLQNALAFAEPGDQVHVAEGTYYPDRGMNETPGARTNAFQLRSNLEIYGGFPPGGGLRNPDPRLNNTVLSGDINQPGVSTDNVFHVVAGTGTVTNAVLDGFTVR